MTLAKPWKRAERIADQCRTGKALCRYNRQTETGSTEIVYFLEPGGASGRSEVGTKRDQAWPPNSCRRWIVRRGIKPDMEGGSMSLLSDETSGPALGGIEPLARSHLRGRDGAVSSTQFGHSASGAMLIAAPTPVAVSRGEETRPHNSSSRSPLERGQVAQALIDVAAALALLLICTVLAGSIALVLFVLLFVKFP